MRPLCLNRTLVLFLAAVLVSSCSDKGGGGITSPPKDDGRETAVAFVEVSAPTTEIRSGSQIQLTATAKSSSGVVLEGKSFTWTSSDTTRARVTSSGLVRGIAEGTARITASIAGRKGAVSLSVLPVPVASVTFEPAPTSVYVNGALRLRAVPRDSAGAALYRRSVTWSSAAPETAGVTADGIVNGLSAGSAEIRATVDGVLGVVTIAVTVPSRPLTGTPVAQLAAFDSAVVAYMQARDIPAGTLAVMRGGRMVLSRGYGWHDRAHTRTIAPDAMLRLASVTKPITAAAIHHLVTEGRLTYDTRVVPFLGVSPLPEGTALGDARLKDITVQHLLDHKGGWGDKAVVPDSRAASRALGLAGPPTPTELAQWMLGKPLQYSPGETAVYNNFGYSLLGLVIEKVTSQSYTRFVQETLFGESMRGEVILARTLPQDRSPREPWYSDPYLGCSVFVISTCQSVPWTDGGLYFEGFHSYGGLVASAPGVLDFLNRYWLSGHPRAAGQTGHWWFNGSMNGTYTYAIQRADGTNIVILLNQRTDSSGLPYEEIRSRLEQVAGKIAEWP